MKQLHKQTSLNHRRDEESTSPYSPKTQKHPRSLPRSIHYLFKEQRLLFILVGILIGSTFFIIQPTLSRLGPLQAHRHPSIPRSFVNHNSKPSYNNNNNNNNIPAKIGRVPAAIGRRRLRIVVTGGAGFVGSHLVDKLIARGDEVIVIDNFFTGRKDNLVHHFGKPRFELIRHDVVEPILLEVDQIYHLACPASPVHYKYNPVKTIISLITSLLINFLLFGFAINCFDFDYSFEILNCIVITKQMLWVHLICWDLPNELGRGFCLRVPVRFMETHLSIRRRRPIGGM